MQKVIEIIEQTRRNFRNLVDGLTIQQLNTIPAGFNNNIIWNYAHIISAQQVLCYRNAGLPLVVDENFVDLFKKGTKPGAAVDETQLSHIHRMAVATIEKLKLDINDGLFSNYQEYTTSYNVMLTNIKDAVRFVATHDALHFGYAMAQRKLVQG
jgi:hypothetical protein